MVPTGTNASSSARSPEILFWPSDSEQAVDRASCRPRSPARRCLASGWPATLPDSEHIRRRIGQIGLAGGGELQPGDLALRHRTVRSLLTVSETSGAAGAPLRVSAKVDGALGILRQQRDVGKARLQIGRYLAVATLALPPACSAPEASVQRIRGHIAVGVAPQSRRQYGAFAQHRPRRGRQRRRCGIGLQVEVDRAVRQRNLPVEGAVQRIAADRAAVDGDLVLRRDCRQPRP